MKSRQPNTELFKFTVFVYNRQTEKTRSEERITQSIWEAYSQVVEGEDERLLTSYQQTTLSDAELQSETWQRITK